MNESTRAVGSLLTKHGTYADVPSHSVAETATMPTIHVRRARNFMFVVCVVVGGMVYDTTTGEGNSVLVYCSVVDEWMALLKGV